MNKAVKELLEREINLEKEMLDSRKKRIIELSKELDAWKKLVANSEEKICEITLFLKESN